jgi:pimeloyl-ACP methyl ester carboxylesterase
MKTSTIDGGGLASVHNANGIKLHLMKTLFSTGSIIAPSVTASLAFWLFCRPQTTELSEEQSKMAVNGRSKLAKAKQFSVSVGPSEVQAYRFSTKNSRETIILVHGWTSEASHMMALVDPLLERRFNVVCFDLPAHGKSTGRATNLIECAMALQAVASLFSNIHGIVAHSFGGPVTALALAGLTINNQRFDVDKIALIASPNESAYVTQAFGDALGLGPQAQSGFETVFENLCGCQLGNFTGSKYFSRINRPLLVLHSRDDCEIPYEHGLHYRNLPLCQFISLEDLGHRSILYAPQVSDCVARFMDT